MLVKVLIKKEGKKRGEREGKERKERKGKGRKKKEEERTLAYLSYYIDVVYALLPCACQ
jgi:hypothetical protein